MREADIPPHRPTTPSLPLEETARLGGKIYERNIRRQVKSEHHGKIVAIAVDTGHNAIADTILAAADALRDQHPSLDAWVVRVGHQTLRYLHARG